MLNSFVAEGTAWSVMVVSFVVVVMMIIFEGFPKLSPSYSTSGGCSEQYQGESKEFHQSSAARSSK